MGGAQSRYENREVQVQRALVPHPSPAPGPHGGLSETLRVVLKAWMDALQSLGLTLTLPNLATRVSKVLFMVL